MLIHRAGDALECTSSDIHYTNLNLSKYYKKGHVYEVARVDNGIVFILDHEGYDYAFAHEDVAKYFKQTEIAFPAKPIAH